MCFPLLPLSNRECTTVVLLASRHCISLLFFCFWLAGTAHYNHNLLTCFCAYHNYTLDLLQLSYTHYYLYKTMRTILAQAIYLYIYSIHSNITVYDVSIYTDNATKWLDHVELQFKENI